MDRSSTTPSTGARRPPDAGLAAQPQRAVDGAGRAAADGPARRGGRPGGAGGGARPHRRHVLRRRRPARGRRPATPASSPWTRRPRDDRAAARDPRAARCRSSRAIDGHVRAGGLGLVGACDIVVAGPREHVRAHRGPHRRGAVDHLADAAAEDDRARRRPLLPHRRDVRRRRGRRHRAGHRRRRRRRGRASTALDRRRSARARRRAWRRRRR